MISSSKNCPNDTRRVPTGYHRKNWAFQKCNCPPLWAIYIFTKRAGILRLVMLPPATLKWTVQVFTNSECSMTIPQNKLPRGCSFTFLTNFSEQLLSNFRILKGQKVLNSGMKLNRSIVQKWSPIVPSPLNLKWKYVWLKTRVEKDVSSIWMVWHQVIEVNVSCVKIEKDIVMMCPSCDFKASMFVIHGF